MITITHTPEDGTVVAGDPRPHHKVLKDAGFTYSGRVGWYIRGSRDRRPQQWRIDQAAAGLREVGFEVTVEVEDGLRPIDEREAARADRVDDRQDALDAKAERKAAESDVLSDRYRQMADRIPFGQPILVGHHSERRHRRDLERMHNIDRKSIDAYREGQDAARRAEASRSNQDKRESGPTTKRRIDTLEAELRDVERKLAGQLCEVSGRKVKAEFDGATRGCPLCGTEVVYGATVPEHFTNLHQPASGEWRERLLQRQVEINDDLTYWREHMRSIGFELLGKDDFKAGDPVLVRGHICEVVRANPKTLTVLSHGFRLKYGYEDVRKPEVARGEGLA